MPASQSSSKPAGDRRGELLRVVLPLRPLAKLGDSAVDLISHRLAGDQRSQPVRRSGARVFGVAQEHVTDLVQQGVQSKVTGKVRVQGNHVPLGSPSHHAVPALGLRDFLDFDWRTTDLYGGGHQLRLASDTGDASQPTHQLIDRGVYRGSGGAEQPRQTRHAHYPNESSALIGSPG